MVTARFFSTFFRGRVGWAGESTLSELVRRPVGWRSAVGARPWRDAGMRSQPVGTRRSQGEPTAWNVALVDAGLGLAVDSPLRLPRAAGRCTPRSRETSPSVTCYDSGDRVASMGVPLAERRSQDRPVRRPQNRTPIPVRSKRITPAFGRGSRTGPSATFTPPIGPRLSRARGRRSTSPCPRSIRAAMGRMGPIGRMGGLGRRPGRGRAP